MLFLQCDWLSWQAGLVVVKRLIRVGGGRGVRFGREQKLILTAEIMGLLRHQIRRLKLRFVVDKQRRASVEGTDGPTCCKPRLFSGGGVGGG